MSCSFVCRQTWRHVGIVFYKVVLATSVGVSPLPVTVRRKDHDQMFCGTDKDKVAAWESIVGAKAAAQHQAVCNLIWTLNQTARKLHTTPTAGEAREAQEVQDLADTVVGLQGSYAQPGLQIADIRSKLGAPWTADLLEDIVHKIRTWRQGILDHCSTGQTSREAEVFEGAPFGLPVRVLVNGMFRADCLDSNDLVKLFCCCTAEDVVLQPDSVISIARQAFPVCH